MWHGECVTILSLSPLLKDLQNMKAVPLLAAALFALPVIAAEPVRLDIYLDGKLQQQASLSGPHAKYQFWLDRDPDTLLELRLIAPEPIIIEVTETTQGKVSPNGQGRIKLVGAGDKVAVSSLKNTEFKHPYVLVRPE